MVEGSGPAPNGCTRGPNATPPPPPVGGAVLYGSVGMAGVDDVRGVGAGAKWLHARLERQRPAATVAVADAVGLGRDRPAVVKETGGRGHGELRRCYAANGGWPGGRAQRQYVARLQLAAGKAAKSPQPVGGATAQHHRHSDATGHGNVGACAAFHEAEAQLLSGLDQMRSMARDGLARDAHVKLGAGDRDDGVLPKLQPWRQQRAFQRRCRFIVGDQQVRQPQRVLVERTRLRYAQVVVARPPQVLHRFRQPRLDDLDAHWNTFACGMSAFGRPGGAHADAPLLRCLAIRPAFYTPRSSPKPFNKNRTGRMRRSNVPASTA